jgi:hypothetical protein
VVFRDKERTKPYAVIECKRDAVSDTEFKQAVEQAFGNGHAHKFRAEYIGVIAGQTRAFYDCSDKFGVLEREANIVADLPDPVRQAGRVQILQERLPQARHRRGQSRRPDQDHSQVPPNPVGRWPPLAAHGFWRADQADLSEDSRRENPAQEGPALRIPDQNE